MWAATHAAADMQLAREIEQHGDVLYQWGENISDRIGCVKIGFEIICL
jgi:hypothetical protein